MAVTVLNPAAGDDIQAALDGAATGPVILNLPAGGLCNGNRFPLWVRRSDVIVNGAGTSATAAFGSITATQFGAGLFVSGDTALTGDERVVSPYFGSGFVAYYLPPGRWLASFGDSPTARPDYLNSSITDGWANVRTLTLKLSVKFDSNLAESQLLCGIEDRGNGTGTPSPWALSATAGGGMQLVLTLADGSTARATVTGSGTQTSYRKLTVQLNLDAGTCFAWIDDAVAAVAKTGFSAAMPKLAANYGRPFLVGATLNAVGMTVGGFIGDFTELYTGGSPIVDTNNRYQSFNGHSFGLFLQTSGTFADEGRWVGGHFQFLHPAWLILDTYHTLDSSAIANVVVNDLQVKSTRHTGPGFLIGNALNLRYQGCRADGGYYGVLQAKGLFESYRIDMTDCYLDGTDEVGHFFTGISCLNRIVTGVGGRRFFSYEGAGGSSLRTLLTNGPTHGRIECYVYAAGPDTDANLSFDDLAIDDEDGSHAANFVAPFVLAAPAASRFTVRVSNSTIPGTDGGRPVASVTGPANSAKCLLVADALTTTATALASGAGLTSGRWQTVNSQPGTAVTALPAATPLVNADVLYVVQGGVDKQATVAQVKNALGST